MKRIVGGFLLMAISLLVYWAFRLFNWQLSPLVIWVWLAGALLVSLVYMALQASYRWGKWGELARKVFLIALVVRVAVVVASPLADKFVDVCVYMDAGQLTSHGINPYDYSDAPELRHNWRTDDYGFTYLTVSTQKDWDFYAGSNLPLAELLFGLWETTVHHVWAYRFGFAFLDALLSAFVFLFVVKLWQGTKPDVPTWKELVWCVVKPSQPLFYAIWLGALSPVLLKSGTLISEPKGTCLLLLVAAFLALYSASRWWAAILVGLSVAFMGLGAFFAPILGWRTLTGSAYFPASLSRFTNWTYFRETILIVAVVVGSALVWFVPYLPEVINMGAERTARSTGMINHASMWRSLNDLIPGQIHTVRLVYGGFFALTVLAGFLLKRLSIETVCAGGALFFLNIIVTEGSLDRVNVSLLMALLLIGREDVRAARHLAIIYLFTGILALLASVLFWVLLHAGIMTEKYSFAYVDGMLCFLFVNYYLYWMVKQLIVVHPHPVGMPGAVG
ncbi:hypothetical protein [Fibrella forsythiae]|uniref:DUF2029 domain-containing protein n=1 Tax=Fibrella forsythiae TaxID=2817061 RepID=A0ABS3JSH5_9BACT|nr:hypothetical protein [Fibrella forsythiae]MBO0952408.1 hypothetical protein [Fibrella forsythiae]